MNTISLRLPLFFGLNPFKRNITFRAPSAWFELNKKQLITVVRLRENIATEAEIMQQFFSIPAFVSKKRLSPFLKYKLINLISFLGIDGPMHAFAVKKIHVGWLRFLHAPQAKLKGVTFAQFIFADTHFLDYQQNKSLHSLSHFVASLYLPRNQAFNENNISSRAALVAQMPLATLKAIALNYLLIRLYIAQVYFLVFRSPAADTDTTNAAPSGSFWIKVFDAIVGADITKQDEYAALPVNTVLRFMHNKVKSDIKKH